MYLSSALHDRFDSGLLPRQRQIRPQRLFSLDAHFTPLPLTPEREEKEIRRECFHLFRSVQELHAYAAYFVPLTCQMPPYAFATIMTQDSLDVISAI